MLGIDLIIICHQLSIDRGQASKAKPEEDE